jgi:uncharacterized protein (TIGR03492 family)
MFSWLTTPLPMAPRRFWKSVKEATSRRSYHHAKVALGTVGTANEQAAGLGIPTPGPQFTLGFAQRQRRLLGPALTLAKPEPTEIAQAVRAVLEEERYRLASAAGKERIGTPGALPRIAEEIQEVLDG